MVAMPKKAATQSQKSEPGPPATRAVAVPGDVAGADLGRHGGRERLEGAHAGLVGALAEKRGAAQKKAGRKTELSHLHEAQLDGVEDAGAAKERNQEEDAPEYAVDVADELIEEIHLSPV